MLTFVVSSRTLSVISAVLRDLSPNIVSGNKFTFLSEMLNIGLLICETH
jgi:hypothetical protein